MDRTVAEAGRAMNLKAFSSKFGHHLREQASAHFASFRGRHGLTPLQIGFLWIFLCSATEISSALTRYCRSQHPKIQDDTRLSSSTDQKGKKERQNHPKPPHLWTAGRPQQAGHRSLLQRLRTAKTSKVFPQVTIMAFLGTHPAWFLG